MAKSLNKDRMFISKIAFVASILLVLFTRETFPDETFTHEFLDILGLLLTIICAMGRVYSTAFLGGHKNTNLITQGPFSVVRNPLYVFSFIGIVGIAIMSNNILVMIGLPVVFYFLYDGLVKREEGFLKEAFGTPYEVYCAHVKRFIPDFSKYNAADTLTMSPRQLWHAFRDNLVWYLPYIAFELIEHIHDYFLS